MKNHVKRYHDDFRKMIVELYHPGQSVLGTQYTSEKFAKTIKKLQMTHSFSYKGSPYGNACIEENLYTKAFIFLIL